MSILLPPLGVGGISVTGDFLDPSRAPTTRVVPRRALSTTRARAERCWRDLGSRAVPRVEDGVFVAQGGSDDLLRVV